MTPYKVSHQLKKLNNSSSLTKKNMTMEENTLHPARKLLLGQLIAYLLLAVAVVVGFESDFLEV